MESRFPQDKESDENADYKKLYFAAVNKLTDIFYAIEKVYYSVGKAQQELEEIYLRQTEESK